jgi:DMSO reductase family type II enzyme heme b subunit
MVLRSSILALLVAGAVLPAARAETRGGAPQLPVQVTRLDQEVVRSGDDAAWKDLPSVEVQLSRTPPLFEGDPRDDGWRPTARVAMVETSDLLFVRLVWDDSTESRLRPPQRYPVGGEAHVYKQHTQDVQLFPDAACVMVPRQTGSRPAFPSLMMGDPDVPVDLYYWNLERGFEHLEAAGRGSTRSTGETFPGRARRTPQGWSVVFQLPVPPPQTPMSFAIWDGRRGHRDGLKWFSVWYEASFGGATP